MRTTNRTRAALLGAVAAAALAATCRGSAASAKTVTGTVGPGFTIGLTMQGKRVTKLKVGKPYRRRRPARAEASLGTRHSIIGRARCRATSGRVTPLRRRAPKDRGVAPVRTHVRRAHHR